MSALPRARHAILAVIVLALAAWIAVDLAWPVRTDIRVFDPKPVARLDTEMWRAYYDRKPLPLFLELAELLRLQFHFPLVRSYVVAAHAARAAFVFKDGNNRADYQRALPDLIAYFEAIRRVSATPFDVRRASERELEWWIVHRERSYASGDLTRALAEAAGALYQVPAARLMVYGHARALAMTIRDDTQRAGGVSERDWQRIELLLRRSWGALRTAVASGA